MCVCVRRGRECVCVCVEREGVCVCVLMSAKYFIEQTNSVFLRS